MSSLGRLNEGKNSAGGGAMYSITGAGMCSITGTGIVLETVGAGATSSDTVTGEAVEA